ncbi:STAS domain-containing protein [Penaeicola halotolerans]|uniref:STAS domain-containing protein n=1 Tax=Penaeicola halotolerans TaxID=2793196 RepID=UPI001CF826A2|nr:STAS domain-containing protein [Penaeicola halotolerans]
MKNRKEVVDGVLLLHLSGDLIGDQDGPRLLEIVNDGINSKITKAIINLEEVRYISSSGIGVLITILTKLRNVGGDIVLAKPSEHVSKLLIITKLNNIFQIYDDVPEALTALK